MTDVGLASSKRLVSNRTIPDVKFSKVKYAKNEKEFIPKWAQKKALDSSSDYSFEWKDWVDLTEVTGLYKAIQVGTCSARDRDCLSHMVVDGPPTNVEPSGFFNKIGKVYLNSVMPKPKKLIYLTEKENTKKTREHEKTTYYPVPGVSEGDFSKSRDAKSILAENQKVRRFDSEGGHSGKLSERDEFESREVGKIDSDLSSRDTEFTRSYSTRENVASREGQFESRKRDIEFSTSDPVHEDSYDDDDNGTIVVQTGETEEELERAADLDVAEKSYLRSSLSRDHRDIVLSREMFEWDIHAEIDRATPDSPKEQLSHSLFLSQQWRNIKKSGKHFSEAWVMGDEKGAGVHYDWRFFKQFDSGDEKQVILRKLVRAWLDFTSREGIITWLAHGTLLGWYWNGQSLPWDFDGDVQMPVREFDRFARVYNQSLIIDETGNRFYVDVGPAYVERLRGNGKNVIDARFIDVDSGMYIDITALAYAEQNEKFHCKNWHRYTLESVSPLRRTLFEGKTAYIPNNFVDILTTEYKNDPLGNTRFEGRLWNPYLRLWVQQDQCENLQIEENAHQKALRINGEPSSFGACYRPEYIKRYEETKEMGKRHEKEMKAILEGRETWEWVKEEL